LIDDAAQGIAQEIAVMQIPSMQGVHMLDHRSASHAFEGRVVHLLGRLNEHTFGLLGAATAALAQASVDQTLVFIDDSEARDLLTGFDAALELVPVPQRRSPLAQWRGMHAAYVDALAAQPLKAVHLHGFVASLVAQRALHQLGNKAPVYYSPHGSRSLESMRTRAALARLLVRPFIGTQHAQAIANGVPEAKALRSLGVQPVRLVEPPVDEAFFDVTARVAKHPLIVTASRSPNVRGVELFAQLAVLLGGDPLHMSFNWLGAVDPVSAKRLQASNVGVFDVRADTERASRMAAGWVYVALAGGRGFPLTLGEAMAVGLPCVAIDTPAHRDLVHHGETGYLCRSRTEIIDRIAQLIDTPGLRHRMGHAASAEARLRFNRQTFFDTLNAAYDLRDPRPANADEVVEPGAQLFLESSR
jgi:glycosyltransferase involved in cell wall biosynthesis